MFSDKRNVISVIISTSVLGLFLLAVGAPCRPQATPPTDDAGLLGTDDLSAVLFPAAADQGPAGESAAQKSPSWSTVGADDAWHFSISPYLWFPGAHGTVTGPRGQGVGFSATPGDLLSHFRLGLMGVAEIRKRRFVASTDLFWIRLGADNLVPFPGTGATSANITANEVLLTPKVGVRLVNAEKLKIDGLAGLRYWHFGESLNFNPSPLGLSFSASQNFVDPVLGGRIQATLAPKIVVNILGDVGGWDTGSQLEYQWAGVLGYKIKPALTLQAGYRYINVDKATPRGVTFDVTTAGVLFGATLSLK